MGLLFEAYVLYTSSYEVIGRQRALMETTWRRVFSSDDVQELSSMFGPASELKLDFKSLPFI